MNEVWKAIAGYDGVYEVSSIGRVRSLDHMVLGRYGGFVRKPGKVLRLKVEKTGYHRVCLRRPGHAFSATVHRLVAETFIPNQDGLPVVNHKDGDKVNNCVENLEWCTYKQNSIHAIQNSLYEHSRGESVCGAKLTESDVISVRNLYADGLLSQKAIADQFGIGQDAISLIVNRKRWKHIA